MKHREMLLCSRQSSPVFQAIDARRGKFQNEVNEKERKGEHRTIFFSPCLIARIYILCRKDTLC